MKGGSKVYSTTLKHNIDKYTEKYTNIHRYIQIYTNKKRKISFANFSMKGGSNVYSTTLKGRNKVSN